jgi:hypothetical protein
MAKKGEPWGATPAAIIGGLFALIVDKVLPLDNLTQHLPLLIRAFLVVLMALAAVLGRHYYVILSGADESRDSDERKRYESLRQRLFEGGTPAVVYNRWLAFVLEKVDEFFGDAGSKETSWIARALYLQTDGPRWTVRAFDRCLLLALVYPIVTVFAVWALSAHVGVAERALLLAPDNPANHYSALSRALSFLLMPFIGYAAYRFRRAERLLPYLSWLAVAIAAIMIASLAGFGAVIPGVAVGVAVGIIGLGATAVAGAIAVAFIVGFASVGAVAGAAVLGFFIVDWASDKSYPGHFLPLFFVAACMVCLAAPYGLAQLQSWTFAGPMLLFFGLLTLVNAPVDWLAIGFTRALLRRGLSLGGWWPFLFALLDILVAAILVSVLAFAMVLAIQTFDDIAVLGAGSRARVLSLGPLFEGLESTPNAYEYWWVWILLFSSMIPSILNLSIATAAFLRSLPGCNTWILNRMPASGTLSERDRLTVASALTSQLVVGVALTGIASYLVVDYLIPLGLPAFGAVVREFAIALANFDAPARAMLWLVGPS